MEPCSRFAPKCMDGSQEPERSNHILLHVMSSLYEEKHSRILTISIKFYLKRVANMDSVPFSSLCTLCSVLKCMPLVPLYKTNTLTFVLNLVDEGLSGS